MTTVYKYRIYCITQAQWEIKWSTIPIEVCPDNPAHTVNPDSVSDMQEKVFDYSLTFASSSKNIYQQGVYTCDSTSNNITITLPPVLRNTGQYFFFTKSSVNNTVTIQGNDGETIDGVSMYTLNDTVMISSENGTSWITDPDDIDSPVGSLTTKTYSCIVDKSGNGNYTSVVAAFNAGNTSVFVNAGMYIETSDIVIPNGGQLIGAVQGETIIVLYGPYSIKIDGSGGTNETTGTISIASNTSIITGTGTTFTNLSAGDFILVGTNYYTISTIDSTTQVTLLKTYVGSSITDAGYKAQSMYTGCIVSNLIVASSLSNGLYVRGLRHGKISSVAFTDCSTSMTIIDSGDLSIAEVISTFSTGVGINVVNCISLSFHTINIFNGSSHGMEVLGSNIINESCACENNSGYGFHIIGDSSFININDCIVKYNNSIGIKGESTVTCTTISNTELSHNNGNGICMQGNNINIIACFVVENSGKGIIIGSENIIKGNTIKRNGGDGIKIPSASVLSIVSGNSMEDNTGIGVNVLAEKCGVSDNNIKESGGDGIYVDGVKNKISGNTIIDSGANGIHIASTGNSNVITGNIVESSAGNGLELITGAVNNIVTSNNLEDNTGANYVDNGTGTSVSNNIV